MTKAQAIKQAKKDYRNEYGMRVYDACISIMNADSRNGRYVLLHSRGQSIEVRF